MAEEKKLTKKDMMDPKVLDKLTPEQIMDNLLRLKLIDPAKDFNKGGAVKKKKKSKDAIGIMVAVGKVKGKPKMSYGGSIGSKKYNYAAGGSVKNNLKPVPQGNKGKGLSKLPTKVRNKMGFMRKGGMV